jgi:predicted nucleic acid-binding protein
VIVVSDATPLIALAKVGRLELLKVLFGTIRIPQSVYDEVVTDSKGRPGSLEVSQASWITTQSPVDWTKVDYLRADLDAGEAEALVLAEELAADWMLLDEAKARLAADLPGFRYIGTIGLLLLAKRLDKEVAIRPLLDELRSKKFYVSDRVYQLTLKQAGE